MADPEPTPFPEDDPAAGLSQALVDTGADRRLDVLRRVAAGCSISQAAREVGISYKAAWQAIDTLTSLSGVELVRRTVGGAGGGGARVTPQGQALLALADALAEARRLVLARFAAGLPPGGLGLGLRTSMRNQLPCTVCTLDTPAPHEPLVQVGLHTAGGAPLRASLTRESAELLGLAPGLAVLVLCKATAVRITDDVPPAPGADGAAGCELRGRVERVHAGRRVDEVTLVLEGGGHWVGFADHPWGGRPGAPARAQMATSALVLGLGG